MFRRISLSVVLLCASAMVSAEENGYIGLGFGSIDYSGNAVSSFDNPTGFEVLLGKDISRNIAFELSYLDYGKADNSASQHLSSDAITAGMLLKAKAGKTAEAYLKLGMFSWNSEITQDGSGVVAKDDGIDIFYGLGVTVKASDNIGIGARYNIYNFNGDNVSMLSINAQLSF